MTELQDAGGPQLILVIVPPTGACYEAPNHLSPALGKKELTYSKSANKRATRVPSFFLLIFCTMVLLKLNFLCLSVTKIETKFPIATKPKYKSYAAVYNSQ